MDKYFTIGDISKLFNMSIKTLRYYDEIGLLKPALVDEDTNYRYYSIDQFVIIDIIKNSKLMGMTLKETKEMIQSYSSIDSISSIIGKQIDLFNVKISELLRIKESMERVQETINKGMEEKHNEVFIAFHEEEKYISYPYVSHNTEEQEINLRKVIIEVESKKREVYSVFGVGTLYNQYIKEGNIINQDIRYYVNEELKDESYNVLPKGYYASIIFDDNSFNKEKYYKILVDYIQNNNLNVVGDFSEKWIIPRVDYNGRESTLVKIEIRIDLPGVK